MPKYGSFEILGKILSRDKNCRELFDVAKTVLFKTLNKDEYLKAKAIKVESEMTTIVEEKKQSLSKIFKKYRKGNTDFQKELDKIIKKDEKEKKNKQEEKKRRDMEKGNKNKNGKHGEDDDQGEYGDEKQEEVKIKKENCLDDSDSDDTKNDAKNDDEGKEEKKEKFSFDNNDKPMRKITDLMMENKIDDSVNNNKKIKKKDLEQCSTQEGEEFDVKQYKDYSNNTNNNIVDSSSNESSSSSSLLLQPSPSLLPLPLPFSSSSSSSSIITTPKRRKSREILEEAERLTKWIEDSCKMEH